MRRINCPSHAICATRAPTRKKDSQMMQVENKTLCTEQGESKVVNVGGLWGGSRCFVCVRMCLREELPAPFLWVQFSF